MKRIILGLAALVMLGSTQKADASGFALIEQSVTSMGAAYAGAGAVAQDASTVWFNPAGMTRINCCNLVSGVHGVFPVGKFHNEGSTLASPLTNVPLDGGNGGNSGSHAAVPHGYFVLPGKCGNCENIWFGFGMNSPFGLVTDYGDDWVGRYHADRSRLFSVNFNPCVAVKLTDCLSFGAGFNWMYVDAKLSNAVDFGLIFSGAGLTPQGFDGKATVTGNSWGYGGNFGLLWDNCCGTRIGVNYRTEVRHHLDGKVRYKYPENVSPAIAGLIQGNFPNSKAVADVTLPSSLSLSVYQRLNNCFAVLADVTWWKWKVLKRLKIRFKDQPATAAISDTTTTLKWENTFRYSLGGEYYYNDCLTCRAGVAYDQTPIPNKHYRTPRIPGEDRTWLATGFSYKWNCFYFDFAYAYLFVREPKVDSLDNAENATRGLLKGHWKAYTNIVSAQIDYRF